MMMILKTGMRHGKTAMSSLLAPENRDQALRVIQCAPGMNRMAVRIFGCAWCGRATDEKRCQAQWTVVISQCGFRRELSELINYHYRPENKPPGMET